MWWVWVIPIFIGAMPDEPEELMPVEPEFIGAIPEDEACVASDFVAIVPVEPVDVLLFGTVAEPAFELDIVEPLIELSVPEAAAGFGAVLPGVVPVAVGSPVEPVGAGVGLAVWAQAMPAVIKTAAEASKSERMGFS
jgi:hypothetical protein